MQIISFFCFLLFFSFMFDILTNLDYNMPESSPQTLDKRKLFYVKIPTDLIQTKQP